MRRPGKNHALIDMIGRCIPVDARVRLRRCIRRLRVIWRNVRDHVVQVDSLIHLETAVQNHIGELDGAQNHTDRIALTIELITRPTARLVANTTLPSWNSLTCGALASKVQVKPSVETDLMALSPFFHQDDARLVVDRGIATRSDSKFESGMRTACEDRWDEQRLPLDAASDRRDLA